MLSYIFSNCFVGSANLAEVSVVVFVTASFPFSGLEFSFRLLVSRKLLAERKPFAFAESFTADLPIVTVFPLEALPLPESLVELFWMPLDAKMPSPGTVIVNRFRLEDLTDAARIHKPDKTENTKTASRSVKTAITR